MNNYDFTFDGSPDDVGMQTGATIHTMNGLKMNVRKLSKDDPPPPTNGWWEKQHLKRGLSASGRPYPSPDDVSKAGGEREGDAPASGCPMH